MPTLDQIKKVIKKISTVEDLGEHLCFFGGSIPYIKTNQESNREHSDIDVMVDEEYMSIIREIVKQNGMYIPDLDSLNLGMDGDYGLKVFIDGVYVEFEPMCITDNLLTRKSFSNNRQLYGEEVIPYLDITDLIEPLEIDGIVTCEKLVKIAVNKI